MEPVTVIGIRGPASFDAVISHFTAMGGDAVLLDPDMVCGKSHIMSAAIHGERAFREGRSRSRSLLTETILYAAGERQIGKALEKMKPKPGRDEFVACIFGISGDFRLDAVGMVRDDSLCNESPAKAANLGIPAEKGIPPGDLALELVASADLLKQ